MANRTFRNQTLCPHKLIYHIFFSTDPNSVLSHWRKSPKIYGGHNLSILVFPHVKDCPATAAKWGAKESSDVSFEYWNWWSSDCHMRILWETMARKCRSGVEALLVERSCYTIAKLDNYGYETNEICMQLFNRIDINQNGSHYSVKCSLPLRGCCKIFLSPWFENLTVHRLAGVSHFCKIPLSYLICNSS